MTNSQQMFLYAAEEMNFTRASARAYVTQQCLSDHVRRLEKSLNTRLFERTPRLKLTKAGEVYYRFLLEIRQMEKRTLEMIADDSENVYGTINLGIQTNRAQFIFPLIYPAYQKTYPNVTVQLTDGHTEDLLDMLEQGKIDMMLGHDALPRNNLAREVLFDEPVRLLASRSCLRRCVPGWNDERTCVEPQELSSMPLACTTYRSVTMDHVNRFLREYGVTVRYVCAAGEYTTLLGLCEKGAAAFFCPESHMLQSGFAKARSADREDPVLAIPIRHMENTVRLELLYRTDLAVPRYMESFRDLLIGEYREQMESFRKSAEETQG